MKQDFTFSRFVLSELDYADNEIKQIIETLQRGDFAYVEKFILAYSSKTYKRVIKFLISIFYFHLPLFSTKRPNRILTIHMLEFILRLST